MGPLLTIAEAVATHARLTPHKLAVRDSHRRLSYAEWDARATRLAAGLLGLGLTQGDRVAVIAHNRLEWMEIYAGMARAGLLVVPLNFRLTGPEIAYILGHAEVGAVIAGPGFCATVDGVRAELTLPAGRFIALGAETEPEGWTGYEALLEGADTAMAMPEVGPKDPCALMYTSGTTGRPKGAIRAHEGSTLIALATALEMGFTRDDTALLVMPLCHANSLYFGTTFVHLGATIVIDDRPSFDPEAVMRTLAEDRVTFTSLVPTHYIMMLSLPRRRETPVRPERRGQADDLVGTRAARHQARDHGAVPQWKALRALRFDRSRLGHAAAARRTAVQARLGRARMGRQRPDPPARPRAPGSARW